MRKYIVIEIGCIECGVSTQINGVYDTEDEADSVAETLPTWRDGGQSSPQVFELDIN